MATAFNTDRALEALQLVSDSLESSTIYNQDWKTAKERLNRAMEQDWDSIKDTMFAGQYHSVNDDIQDLVYYSRPQMHTVKSVEKKLNKVKDQLTDEQYAELRHALDTYAVIAGNLALLKGMIVMGRKPANNPNAAPERTLENTGTCSVCGRNVKLDNSGHIVSHGYTVSWGMGRSSSCSGVHFKPWEVSPAGAEEYIYTLESAKASTLSRIADMEADKVEMVYTTRGSIQRGEPRFEITKNREIEMLKRNLPAIKATTKEFIAKVEGWKVQPLPMQK
ncbi:MAG: hypothetical protein DRQ35_00560 [Gammaproteobacteria bacterium]|nr:MAG: hypothetical protein DRQ35_00560 [Gammaproteobacteria bacterium]